MKYPDRRTGEPDAMKELASVPGVGYSISAGVAGANFSTLLELVSSGHEVTILGDGKPLALLLPLGNPKPEAVFTGTLAHLRRMPGWTGGETAEQTIRADREARS
jgi:antitoxin (DNA-binding transcriptional repressor) of toxin-antitoxin stability system